MKREMKLIYEAPLAEELKLVLEGNLLDTASPGGDDEGNSMEQPGGGSWF